MPRKGKYTVKEKILITLFFDGPMKSDKIKERLPEVREGTIDHDLSILLNEHRIYAVDKESYNYIYRSVLSDVVLALTKLTETEDKALDHAIRSLLLAYLPDKELELIKSLGFLFKEKTKQIDKKEGIIA